MKLSVSTILPLLPLISCTPLTPRDSQSTFRLSVSYPNISYSDLQTGIVSYVNGSAQIGRAKYSSFAEPLLLLGGNGGLSFLSYHQTPTGFVQLYIRPGETAPLGFGTPHGSVPSGVQTTGFTFNKAGNLTVDGKQDWIVCATPEQEKAYEATVYWKGDGKAPGGVKCKSGVTLTKEKGCYSVLY